MGTFDGEAAIITGGTSGIGEACVGLFVQKGTKIVIAAPRENEGEALSAHFGQVASIIRTDVARKANVASPFASTSARACSRIH